MRRSPKCTRADFSDQIAKIYYQGARAAQPTFEQPRGGHHTFEHRDEMRRDRIWGRSKNTLLNSERALFKIGDLGRLLYESELATELLPNKITDLSSLSNS